MKSSLWYVKNKEREFIGEADIDMTDNESYCMKNVGINDLPNILGVNELVVSEPEGPVIKKINKVSYSNHNGEKEVIFRVATCKK